MNFHKPQGFTLIELLVVISVLGILSAALIPTISNSVLQASMTEVGTKGRDIFVAIASANAQRKLLGLDSLWPKTQVSGWGGSGELDISELAFHCSSDYFYELNDGANFGTEHWKPYVVGFDWGKLAGAGVPEHTGYSLLRAENNMWTIAANIRDDMDEIIPVLITRNLYAYDLVKQYNGIDTIRVRLGSYYNTPFSNKGFVIIRKSGAIFKARSRYSNLHVIYQGKAFDTNVIGNFDPDLTYLTPDRQIHPK